MTMSHERQARIAKLVKDERVKHIQLWFTDILGNLKMVEIPDRQLGSVMESGAPFDGSSITGYAEIEESDIVAMPDWDTLKLLPWSPASEKTAFVFCDILDRDFQPFEGDPRWVLRRQLERARKMGLEFYVGPEIEYFYFKTPHATEIVDEGGYFSVLPDDLGNDLRKQTMSALDKLGIPMEASHHEVAPSQHEIDPHYDKALEMADRVMIARLIVKEVAAHNGVHATFMPKPLSGEAGSALHVHQSLFRGNVNAFFSADDPDHLSDIAKGFIAGQLRHTREITSVLNQLVNSYKRLVPGYEAPVYISWAHRNRTASIRVPLYIKGKESSLRAEMRNPDPAANPYLALAVLLSAGLEGIERGYELPPPVEPNIYKMNAEQRDAIGLEALPNNLYEAIKATRDSELVRRTLGDHVFERFITNKLNEWSEYREHVTDFEIKRYLSQV
jgi:glutamine synthetase